MRPAPRPIPQKLPAIPRVFAMIQRGVVERPDIRLCDRSIGQLWEELNDGTPVWLTGSNVWIPAVYGPLLKDPSDYDLIFSSAQSCDRFVQAVISVLNGRLPAGKRYTVGKSSFGSHRVMHPDGRGVIDAWSLGEHDSICEMLMTYPHAYQRAAYYLSRSPSAGCVFRIVKDPTPEIQRKSGIFEQIKEMSRDNSYPGKDDSRPPQINARVEACRPNVDPPAIYQSFAATVREMPPGVAAPSAPSPGASVGPLAALLKP